MKTIFVIGGATGGHLFPALSIASELKDRFGCRVIVLLNARAQKLHHSIPVDAFTYVDFPSITHKFNLVQIIKAFFYALKLIDTYSPDAIVGFGSSITFPLILAGRFKKKKLYLHEQNAVFGFANKWSRFFCERVALSFPIAGITENERYVLTGNLLRPEIKKHLDMTRYIEDRAPNEFLRLFVFGGSQGAQFINKTIRAAMQLFSPEELKKIRLYHVVGENENLNEYKDIYERLLLEHYIWKFNTDIGQIYAVSDMVISRAGAGAVCENLAFGIPSLLIPYPFANAHQLKNALYVSDRGAGVCVEQKNMTPEKCKELILDFLHNPQKRIEMSRAARKIAKTDASQVFSSLIYQSL
jgi:UDP-N-acetylglucosamine--N-acetylmuramyl-(pentapeptide) pyrophosphoryl-undecaprenol N-acetylglucosamine transferase